MFKKIIVAIDGSDHAGKAVQTAFEMATVHSAELHMVHVATFPAAVVDVDPADTLIPNGTLQLNGTRILQQAKSSFGEEHNVKIIEHVELCEDSPAKRILALADDLSADLIVVGSIGHSDLSGLLMGSVSHKLCNHAKCACLVVR